MINIITFQKVSKAILILILVVFLFCAPPKAAKIYVPKNVEMIIKSIANIDLADKVKPNEKIALVSIEFGEPTDFPVSSLVEDELIQKMYEMGVIVLERDNDVLKNIIAESEQNYTFRHHRKSLYFSSKRVHCACVQNFDT